jgi:hypothetical protein
MDIAIVVLVLAGVALGAVLVLVLLAPARNAALGAWSLASRGRPGKEERPSDPGR